MYEKYLFRYPGTRRSKFKSTARILSTYPRCTPSNGSSWNIWPLEFNRNYNTQILTPKINQNTKRTKTRKGRILKESKENFLKLKRMVSKFNCTELRKPKRKERKSEKIFSRQIFLKKLPKQRKTSPLLTSSPVSVPWFFLQCKKMRKRRNYSTLVSFKDPSTLMWNLRLRCWVLVHPSQCVPRYLQTPSNRRHQPLQRDSSLALNDSNILSFNSCHQ